MLLKRGSSTIESHSHIPGEKFMKPLNKTEQRAHLQNKSMTIAIQELLTVYRSTPHPAIGITPFEAMMNRQVRTKIDYTERESRTEISKEEKVNKRVKGYKMKIKGNVENSNTNPHKFAVEDHVQLEQNKSSACVHIQNVFRRIWKTTLFAKSFRRRFFAYHYAVNHPHTNIILS